MSVSEDRGYTLVELLVGMFVTLIVFAAIMTIVQVATRHQDQVAERVAANQQARPAMTGIISRLHAACVASGIAPVQAGSTGEMIILLSQAGDDVSPTPDRYEIGLEGTAIDETVYAATGGAAPKWTFSETPVSSTRLADGVTPAELGDPAAPVPLFRYYAYEDSNQDGEVESVLLSSPLNTEEAARTVQVEIAFTVAPSGGGADPGAPIALTDSATLRIEPASEDSAEVNRPCV